MPVGGEAVLAEYWHIGETKTRLRSVTPRNPIGSKRCDTGTDSGGSGTATGLPIDDISS